MDKKEEVVLVTGCSSGFGRLSVESLARKGYGVFASMRESAGRNASARDQLAELARRERLLLKVIELDVTDEASVNSAVDGVIAEAGRIDVLVNNAGFVYWSLTEGFSVEQAQRIFDTNFFGVTTGTRVSSKTCPGHGGRPATPRPTPARVARAGALSFSEPARSGPGPPSP